LYSYELRRIPKSGPGSPGDGAPLRDVFDTLDVRLRDVLPRRPAIWQPTRGETCQARAVFVHPRYRLGRARVRFSSRARRAQNMQFPPREFPLPPDTPGGDGDAAHRSLSSRVPALPLHPDGSLAPMWACKYPALLRAACAQGTALRGLQQYVYSAKKCAYLDTRAAVDKRVQHSAVARGRELRWHRADAGGLEQSQLDGAHEGHV
jgi:hypothetical protein